MASMIAASDSSMNVQVSGRHVDLGDALRTRIIQDVVAGIGKYFERGGGHAEVVVSRDRHSFCVDVVVVLASGQQLLARGMAGDAHAAFDLALTKVETRIRRYKRRLVNHHAHAGVVRSPGETAAYTVLRSPEDEGDFDEAWGSDGAGGAPAAMIIAETQASVRTQTVSMAVMDLDLADSPVVLFRNAAHGGLSVVYRRQDGNIGWIDPERTRVMEAQ